MIEFDPAKDAANIAKHGVSLARAEQMDLDTAVVQLDDRFDYGEDRYIAVGPIGAKLWALVYTPRGDNIRAISLRPANRREAADWRGQSPLA